MLVAILVILSLNLVVNVLIMFMLSAIVANTKRPRETELFKAWGDAFIKAHKK